MDAGLVSFQDHDGETVSRYFLNISSVGLAASVIKRVKSTKIFDWMPIEGLRGKANFAMSALQEVIAPDAATVRVRIDDGDEHTMQTLCLCIANSRFFGGGMMIAPDAKINDGLLDVINVGDMSTAKIIFNAYSLYKGTHLSINEVNSTLAKKIEVSALDPSHEILLETDGEMPGRLPAVYQVVPNAIRVRIPRSKV